MNPAKQSRKQPVTRDPELTKSKILDAAAAEFAIGGLTAARTEAIAAQTGVTKAMIYYYFDSKEDLYRAVMERCLLEDLKLVEELHLEMLPPQEALVMGLRIILQKISANPQMASIMALESIQNKGKYYPKQTAEVLYGKLMCLLEQGTAEGVFRQLDPRHTAINIIGTCAFYFIALENIKFLWPGKRMLGKEMMQHHAQEAMDMILAGILAEPYVSKSIDANLPVF
jgi:TetR/AcrR family transcriptional regulator